LAGLATAGSAQYVSLAGLVALLTAGLLLLARLLKLGFLADFLSRTVLIGFLTGVGFQVGIAVLNEMLKVEVHGSNPVGQLLQIVRQLPHANIPTLCPSAGVAALVLLLHRFAPRFQGALLAVVGRWRQAQRLISQDMESRWSARSQGDCLIFRSLR
jgi:MFS superfamily sulfate permease-like transporter